MQREKFSDITVNIDIEKTIKSASFGCPLLVFPDSIDSSANVYLECEGYDDAVKKYIDAISADVKTVPLTTPTAKVEWNEEKGGITTFSNTGSGTIYTNGNGASNDDGLINYNGTTYNYLDCSEYASITFNSSDFNRPILKFGAAMMNSNGIKSSKFNNSYISIIKNGVVISSYNVTPDEPIMISERLSKPSTGTTDTYTICWSRSIYLFDLAVYNINVRVMDAIETFYMQEKPPKKNAMFLFRFSENVTEEDTAVLFEQDWRSMVYIGNINEFIKYASRYAEIKKDKLIFILDDGTDDSTNIQTEFSGRERTVVFYNNNDKTGKGAKTITALVAETASKEVGSFTYKNIPLINVTAANITPTELMTLHESNINSYVTKCGVGVTSEGKTMSGEYIDIIDAKDWIILQIEYRLQQALINNDKIPYDNNGISLLESIVVNTLQDAYNNGMIAEDDDGQPVFTVNFAKRSETKASDREKRLYVEGKFSFDRAGAIHGATVNGIINI